MDSLKKRCQGCNTLVKHYEVVCPPCLLKRRDAAVAKAGPQMRSEGGLLNDHWLDRILKDGVYDHCTGDYTLTGCIVPGVTVRDARQDREAKARAIVADMRDNEKRIEGLLEGLSVAELQAQLANGDPYHGERYQMALQHRTQGWTDGANLRSSTRYERVDASVVKRVLAGMQEVCGIYVSKSRGPVPATRKERYGYLNALFDAGFHIESKAHHRFLDEVPPEALADSYDARSAQLHEWTTRGLVTPSQAETWMAELRRAKRLPSTPAGRYEVITEWLNPSDGSEPKITRETAMQLLSAPELGEGTDANGAPCADCPACGEPWYSSSSDCT